MKTIFFLFFVLKVDSTIVFDFQHILKDPIKEDTASGQIYRNDTLFYISVENPLKQVLYFSSDTMIINYPSLKRAFKVKSGITFKHQTPGGPIGRRGANLKNAGFMFLKREVNSERKTEIWIHPENGLKIIYAFEGDRLVDMVTLSDKGDTIVKITYADYQKVKDWNIPMTLKIKSSEYEEIYKLSNPRVVPFTDSLRNYLEIAKDVKVEYKGFDK